MEARSLSLFDPAPDQFAPVARAHGEWLERAFPSWGRRLSESLARQLGQGALQPLLWEPAGGAGPGGLWVEALSHEVRIHGVWGEPDVGPTRLAPLLAAIERRYRRRVGVLTDALPGLGDPAQAAALPPLGYWHRAKVRMRRAAAPLPALEPIPPEIRGIRLSDLPAAVGVYARAYSERPGEFWTWANPAASAEAERDVMGHLDARGAWAPDFHTRASLVWVESGRVVGAILVSRDRRRVPYIEDLVVEPAHQRRGIGRALLGTALARLAEGGPVAVELAAIGGGAPHRLYRSLGFTDLPPPDGRLDGHWVRGSGPALAERDPA